MAEVAVDIETGFVRVNRIVCVQDCGLVVNRLASISQINGGIIMGIGFALYEERIMDAATGVVLNPNFETYLEQAIFPTLISFFRICQSAVSSESGNR